MKNLRIELGFTQEELAVLLGVSRSLITLYEKGMRNLTGKALNKLSKIQLLVAQADTHKPVPCRKLLAMQQQHRQRAQSLLHHHAKKAAEQAVRVSMQLAALRERIQQQEAKLQLIQLLMQNATEQSREWRLLQNMEEQLLHTLDICNPAAQYTAAYRLALLHTKQQIALDMHKTLQRRNKE